MQEMQPQRFGLGSFNCAAAISLSSVIIPAGNSHRLREQICPHRADNLLSREV
jgi:hypothetical protein